MNTIIVQRSNESNLKFQGEVMAHVSDKNPTSTGRWLELTLYRTNKNKFICQEEHITIWQGEHNHYKAEIYNSLDNITAFFGYSNSAKNLYDMIDLDHYEHA